MAFKNQNTVSGIIYAIGKTEKVSERFSKRTIVLDLTDNEKYPQFVEFQATGKRTGILDGYKVGDEVSIEFGLRGREWKSPKGETKFFVSLDVSGIEAIGEAANVGRNRNGEYVPDPDPSNGQADPWAGL